MDASPRSGTRFAVELTLLELVNACAAEDEKAFVRSTLERLLLVEPTEQIALHLTLLVANIAQFDFPERWPTLLAALVGASAWANQETTPVAKTRALRTLKHTSRALASKTPSINTTERDAAKGNLQALVQERVSGVAAMRAAATSILPNVRGEWSGHLGILKGEVAAAQLPVH
eukprot:SAG11_NODE_4358_length_1933_cov_2.229553_1_plen_173_part_10